MRSRDKITDQDGIYFITSTIVEWLPVFTSLTYFQIIINSLKFCIKNKALKLYAYVILDNHFHLIVPGLQLSKNIQDFKKFLLEGGNISLVLYPISDITFLKFFS